MKQHKPIKVNIGQLMAAEWNYKIDDEYKERKFLQSLKTNGLIYRMVVAQRAETPDDDKYEVCDGNHRLRVLKAAGIKKVEVYNMGRLSLAQRQRLAVELNEWTFEIDHLALSGVLNNIITEFELDDVVLTMPYDKDVLESMVSLTADQDNVMENEEPYFEDSMTDEDTGGGTKQMDVPEVVMVFSTHADFSEFKELLNYESGQHVNWHRVKQALTSGQATGGQQNTGDDSEYLANTSSPW